MERETYGLPFPKEAEQPTIELRCFAREAPLGRYQHLRNGIDLIWNRKFKDAFIWNDFSEMMMQEFCESDWVTVTGAAATWKTTSAALYALTSYFSSPHNTVVICTSTTLDGLRRRIWKEITKYWRMRPAVGNLVQSKNCIQFVKGSDDAGIFGIATDKGEVDKAIGRIIGFHAPNVIVLLDEMPFMPEAIIESCVNLRSGAKRFQFIGLGNATDQLDPHGRMCEPKDGWESVTVEDQRWETKRGTCIHLDGLKSPNVKLGKTVYPGLFNQSDIDFITDFKGADSPRYWQMVRGYWPPEGVTKTVLTMPMIVRAKARDKAVFDFEYVSVAALDPAFEGGDRCTLRNYRCGEMDGKKVLELRDKRIIKTVNSPNDPIHYQIVRQCKEICEGEWGVLPTYFSLDSTGEGGGLHSIFQREWSREILGVEFGGRPSKRPLSQTNSKRADQEYDRKVTELWFFFRVLLQNEQIFGLDDETATEFCRRWYEMRGPYISIETKLIMKTRTGRSPDWADNAVIATDLCAQRLNLLPDQSGYPSVREGTPWQKFLKKRSLESTYESEAA